MSRYWRALSEEREEGNDPLKKLEERSRYRRSDRREREDGSDPESPLKATERFWRFSRKPISGDRVPVRPRKEILRDITWRLGAEEQTTPAQVQWWVVEFQEDRELCGSSVIADFMPSRALYSGNNSDRAWMKYSWRKRETRMKNRIVLNETEDRERQGEFAVFKFLLDPSPFYRWAAKSIVVCSLCTLHSFTLILIE